MAFEHLIRMAQRLAAPRNGRASEWRSPVRLDRGALGEAALALDSHGRGLALWDNGGKLWTLPVGPHVAPALARLPLGEGTSPRLWMNAEGRGLALWLEEVDGRTHLLGRPLGGESEPTQVLQRAAGSVHQVQAAIDRRGNALVVWLQETPSGLDVMAQAFDLRSASWEAEALRLGLAAGGRAGRMRLAANHREHAMVLWTEEEGSEPCLAASHFWPNDRLWSDRPVPVAARATQHHQVAMDDAGNALALWIHAPYGRRSTLEASAYDAHRCEWGAPETLAQADVLSQPRLAMNGAGEALAVWCQAEGHGASRLLCRSFHLGAWTPGVECLELGHEPVQTFSLDVGVEGRATLVAVHRGPAGDQVTARLRHKGAWGETQVLVPPSPVPCAQPQARLCPQGASALWLQGVGRDRALFLGETW